MDRVDVLTRDSEVTDFYFTKVLDKEKEVSKLKDGVREVFGAFVGNLGVLGLYVDGDSSMNFTREVPKYGGGTIIEEYQIFESSQENGLSRIGVKILQGDFDNEDWGRRDTDGNDSEVSEIVVGELEKILGSTPRDCGRKSVFFDRICLDRYVPENSIVGEEPIYDSNGQVCGYQMSLRFD